MYSSVNCFHFLLNTTASVFFTVADLGFLMVPSHCGGNSNGKLNFFRCCSHQNVNAATCFHDTHFFCCRHEWVLNPSMTTMTTTQKIDLFCRCHRSVNKPLDGTQGRWRRNYLTNFGEKLHENEKKWVEVGHDCSL